MSNPYLGEIRLFAGNYAPTNWALCQGQSLSIPDNLALFALLGTTYGGDGQKLFNLPNLASRAPLHPGTGSDGNTYLLGDMIGTETVTLTSDQMPVHSHPIVVSGALGTASAPAKNSVLAATASGIDLYYEGEAGDTMSAAAITKVGASQPHDNVQPFLCVSFIIALQGTVPPKS